MPGRHRLWIYLEGRFVLTLYGHLQGNVEHTGRKIFNFIRNPDNIDSIKRGCKYLRPATEEEVGLNEAWKRTLLHLPAHLTGRFPYPTLGYLHASDALAVLASAGQSDKRDEEKAEKDGSNIDAIPCTLQDYPFGPQMIYNREEHAYLIDLDKNTFEMYAQIGGRSEEPPNRLQEYHDERMGPLIKCRAVYELAALSSLEDSFAKAEYDAKEDLGEGDMLRYRDKS